jgi:hypothetical protein
MNAKRVSVTLPSEILSRIDEKAKSEGMTRQQLIAALIDLGLYGRVKADPGKILGPLETTKALRHVQGADSGYAYRHLRHLLWEHLDALISGAKIR